MPRRSLVNVCWYWVRELSVCLTTSLLQEFPLETLVTADPYELRRKASLNLKVSEALDPNSENFQNNLSAYAQRKFDLTFELSGNPSALDDALCADMLFGSYR